MAIYYIEDENGILKYYVASKLRESGTNCVVLPEPARNSPLVDDVVLREEGSFDIPLEVDLVMSHISQCIRGTRDGEIILSDRTPVNVLAYAQLLVDASDTTEKALLEKCESLIDSRVNFYDLIFYCQDFYFADVAKDSRRRKMVEIQEEVDLETRRQYEKFGCKLRYVPEDLSLEEKGEFVFKAIQGIILQRNLA